MKFVEEEMNDRKVVISSTHGVKEANFTLDRFNAFADGVLPSPAMLRVLFLGDALTIQSPMLELG
jgi:hypothetical protein